MLEPAPPPSLEEDDALIRRIVAGDRQAFESLYERYAPRLRGYLRAQLGQPDLVEDICQEVFLIVWTHADRFQHTSRLSTWIYGIAWRQARKADARHRTLMVHSDASPETKPEVAAGLEVDLQHQEHIQAVAQALADLPVRLHQSLTLQYVHDYSYQQIATEMGCSQDSVKRYLRQARRRLAVALRRSEPIREIAV